MNFKHLIYLPALSALLVLFILVPRVEAVPILTSSDIPTGPLTKHINFDGLGLGAVDTQYATSGVTFSGGAISFLAPDQVLSVDSAIRATFSVNVNMIGVDFFGQTLLTLEAYDASDNLIELVNATTLNGFFGLSTGTQMISYAIIHDHGYGFTIDNFIFVDPPAQVPELGILVLLGSGLVGLGFVRRKFKA